MGRARRRAGRPSPGSEAGFTLIEVMAALLLLTVGIFAVATTFDFSRASTSQSELETAAVDRAQREIEAIRSLPYAQVAHPVGGVVAAAVDDADDPAARVSGTSFAWDRSNGAASEPLAISADGAVPMKQTIPRDDGDRFGYTIWRFVTASDEPACATVDCPEGGGYKRVTVVVRASGLGDTLAPVWTSTTVIDPAAAANNEGTPQTLCQKSDGSGLELCSEEVEGISMDLYLTNTPAGSDARVVPAQSGPLHSTVAIPSSCRVGATVGCPVPDLMVGEPLPQLAEEDPVPPLASFATDVDPTVEAGRPLLEDVACDDPPSSSGDSDAVNLAGAYWVSPALDAAVELLGAGGLYLYTRTWSGTANDVTLCGIVYETPASIANPVQSPPREIGRIDATIGWPDTAQPVSASFDFDFGADDPDATVEAGERIGLRLWVADGSADQIVLLYDHPLNQSRLTLVVEEEAE